MNKILVKLQFKKTFKLVLLFDRVRKDGTLEWQSVDTLAKFRCGSYNCITCSTFNAKKSLPCTAWDDYRKTMMIIKLKTIFCCVLQDIDWDPVDGQFLVSVSSDQTTRLHAPWKQEGLQVTSSHIASLHVL